jgi:pimeloyl-ACP methyl ester carboxylesterase
MEMFNDLRSFPEIRENYQFWFYLYPTGEPYWLSAAQMRKDLAQIREDLDPIGANPSLGQMVLVGHSMGGLVSRLQTIHSGNDFWHLLSESPFQELEASASDKEKLAELVFFSPNPAIRRVVTIGTPHRGSKLSNDYTQWLGRKLIQLPTMFVQENARIVRSNPDRLRNTELLTVTTSVDSLSPKSQVTQVVLDAERAPWVTYHNIVGVLDRGALSHGDGDERGDGVVSLASARMEDTVSELTVNADHMTVHQEPSSILEVRRILLEHLVESRQQIARPNVPGPR